MAGERKPYSKDLINPDHYNDTELQPFVVVDDWELDYYTGSAIKYIKRRGDKEGTTEIDDIKKAIRFLQHRVEFLENK